MSTSETCKWSRVDVLGERQTARVNPLVALLRKYAATRRPRVRRKTNPPTAAGATYPRPSRCRLVRLGNSAASIAAPSSPITLRLRENVTVSCDGACLRPLHRSYKQHPSTPPSLLSTCFITHIAPLPPKLTRLSLGSVLRSSPEH